jgi:KaiC/GvpD/RAD55 family RecA-like ATPase
MRCSTGIPGLDELLDGGLILGENVVWEIETGTFPLEFVNAFIKQGIAEKKQVIYLDFIYPPQALLLFLEPMMKEFPKGWEKYFLVLDCFSASRGRGEFIFTDFYDTAPRWIRQVPNAEDPNRFHLFFGRIEREFVSEGSRLIFNSLTAMEKIWGSENTQSIFSHICPALYAYKTLAYWTINRQAHNSEFLAAIEHTTQVVVQLRRINNELVLQIKQAGGRYNPETYKQHRYSVDRETIALTK